MCKFENVQIKNELGDDVNVKVPALPVCHTINGGGMKKRDQTILLFVSLRYIFCHSIFFD